MMWRNILALILLPSLTAAQAERPTTPQMTSGPLYPEPTYQAYTMLNQIRPGMSEDIVIVLPATHYVSWTAPSASSVSPMEIEISSGEGFTFKKFRFPKPRVQKFGPRASPMRVIDGGKPILFSMKVGDNVTLGKHMLKVKLNFKEVIPQSGMTIPRQVDIQLPVTVVSQDAKFSKNDDYPWLGYSVEMKILMTPVLVGYLLMCGLTLGAPKVCEM